MKIELGMPIQCIQTAKALVEVYGTQRAIEHTQQCYDTLLEAHKEIEHSNFDLRIRMATLAQFWREVNESIDKPTLGRDFFETLNPVH